MADMTVSWGLDASGATSGLEAVARSARSNSMEAASAVGQATRSMERQFLGMQTMGPAVFGALGTAAGLAVKSVYDYAQMSDYAASRLQSLEEQGKKTWTAIGRDISGLADGDGGGLVGMLESVRQGTVDLLAVGIRAAGQRLGLMDRADGTITDVEDARAAEELKTRRIKSRLESERFINDLMAQRYEKEGSLVEAAELKARKFREQSLKELSAKKVEGSDLTDARNAIDAEAEKMVRDARDQQNARQRKTIEDNASFEARKSKRLEDLGFDRQAMTIETMRLEGRKKEADLLQLELDTKKKISEISKDELLTAEQRRAALDDIRSGAAAQRSAIENQKEDTGRSTFRRLQGGLAGGAALEALVFGGRSDPVKDKLAEIGDHQVKLLGRIADAVENDERLAVLA
jgi:hypothetical protein